MDTTKLAEQNLIYKARIGSNAYGTALPTSDNDEGGIFIPPLDYYFGLQAFDILSEQREDDKSYYSLRKFAHFAADNNPNVLELLFVDDNSILLSSPAGEELRAKRKMFLSQRCRKTFVGYATAQLTRIRNHTKWLSQEVYDMNILMPLVVGNKVTEEWVAWRFGTNMVERLSSVLAPEFWYKGLIYDADKILEMFRSSSIICPDQNDDRFYKTEDSLLSTDFTGVPFKTRIFQKHLYDEAKKKRDQYVTWMAERSPERHETEIEFGYDTKHAMHLVRLLRMGYEILTEGELRVRRPDAAELLDIRAGKWTYEQVVDYANEMVEKIDECPQRYIKVAIAPDTKEINRVVVAITREYLEGYHGDRT